MSKLVKAGDKVKAYRPGDGFPIAGWLHSLQAQERFFITGTVVCVVASVVLLVVA